MQIQATIHEIGETQLVSESFQKRDLIVEYAENPTYPEYIRFELLQEKCDILDNFKKGDLVDVDFNLRGRPWTDKTGKTSYFNSLVVWKMNKVGGTTAKPKGKANAASDDDDLPF